MMLRHVALAAVLFALGAGCGASAQSMTIVQDVVVRLDPPADRSPLEGPSARLSAAAREVRELLGHPIELSIDAAIAPASKDVMDFALTRTFEALATELTRWKTRDPSAFALARKRLVKVAVRYDPTAGGRLSSRFDGEGTIVVIKPTKDAGDFVPIGAVLRLLQDTSEGDDARAFAAMDPAAVPRERHEGYARWVSGLLRDPNEPSGRDRERTLARIPLAIRFSQIAAEPHAETLRRFLIDRALSDLAYGHLGQGPEVDRASDALTAWLEQRFDTLPESWRKRAVYFLLGRGVSNPRLLEPSIRLAMRVVDAWARAGHPLPGERTRIPGDFETVVCPHPKNENDGRSLAPNCEGGLVRTLLQTENGATRLGQLLATKRDPIFTEHVFVSAGYSSYAGDERKLIALLRAIETDPALLRVGLRVVAEEHAHGATLDLWLAETRRLWLARPASRGPLLYLLAHLDPYGNRKIDFEDFAGDFGAPVSGAELQAFLDEGYRALSMLHIVWPALRRGFARAPIIEPKLGAWLDDPRLRRFHPRDPHEALTQIRHRLCDERGGEDLRALGAAIKRASEAKPGRALDDVVRIYDLKTCDPPRPRKKDLF